MFKFLQKKPTPSAFTFVGNRPHIRTETELSNINKEEADKAYKQYKKEIMDTLLLSHGFYKYKTNAYVRINPIGLLEYIDLQKERYGSKTFCVNFSVMPLYIQSEVLIFGLGDRLGTYLCGEDVWWDYASEQIARVSFQNVADAVRQYVFPWFDELSTEEGYRNQLSNLSNKKLSEKWLNALEYTADKETLVSNSIITLGLPKKIR